MTTSKAKPVIVMVPGLASVGTVVYEPLVAELKALGWADKDLIAVDNPSVDSIKNKTSVKPNALDADIANLRNILLPIIEEQNRDVLLVGHSYGGAPTLSASRGLWSHQRSRSGKEGGIVKIGLIAAGLPTPGGTIAGQRSEWQRANGVPEDTGSAPEMIDGEPYLTPTGFENIWMNDITDERYRSSLRQVALSCCFTPMADNVDPKDWKINYLILTERDLAMPEKFQRHLIEKGREAGAQIQTTELDSGHFAQISNAKKVADWVKGLV